MFNIINRSTLDSAENMVPALSSGNERDVYKRLLRTSWRSDTGADK